MQVDEKNCCRKGDEGEHRLKVRASIKGWVEVCRSAVPPYPVPLSGLSFNGERLVSFAGPMLA